MTRWVFKDTAGPQNLNLPRYMFAASDTLVIGRNMEKLDDAGPRWSDFLHLPQKEIVDVAVGQHADRAPFGLVAIAGIDHIAPRRQRDQQERPAGAGFKHGLPVCIDDFEVKYSFP